MGDFLPETSVYIIFFSNMTCSTLTNTRYSLAAEQQWQITLKEKPVSSEEKKTGLKQGKVTKWEENTMYEDILERRYAPGKRQNSFYMDLPRLESYERRMEALDEFPGYTYYIDRGSQKLVCEKLR